MLSPNRESSEFLFLLVCADALFITLHLFHIHTAYFTDVGYAIDREKGFGEVFQYLKQYWIVVMFIWLGFRKSHLPYLALALLFGYLLIDDSFQLHEKLGDAAESFFGYRAMLGQAGDDFGELTVFALMGAIFLLIFCAAYYWGSDDFRNICVRLALLLIPLAFFGVVVDLIHAMTDDYPTLHKVLGTVEDGGEMLAMSVICWYVLYLLRRERSAHPLTEAGPRVG